MAPISTESKPMYQKDEKALCFHGELLYEAKVLEVRKQDPKEKQSPHEYRVHYKGWKNTWDDWVPQDRLRKLTDDNKELAANLRKELVNQNAPKSVSKPSATSKHRKAFSEIGSGRGSEERTSSVPAGARGTKRGRDNDIEKRTSTRQAVHQRMIEATQGEGQLLGHEDEDNQPAARPSKRQKTNTEHRLVTTNKYASEQCQLVRKSTRTGTKKLTRNMTVEEILSLPLPPDELEHISHRTAQRCPQLFWAPLIGGTTMDEKQEIELEAGIDSRSALPYHPEYVKTRIEDPGNLNKLLFFEGVDLFANYPVCGVSTEPLSIDPPGCETPFDALLFPDRLVALLNRRDWNSFYDWKYDMLDEIPINILTRLDTQALLRLPSSIRNKLVDQTPLYTASTKLAPKAIANEIEKTVLEPLTKSKPRRSTGLEIPNSQESATGIPLEQIGLKPSRSLRKRDCKGHPTSRSSLPKKENSPVLPKEDTPPILSEKDIPTRIELFQNNLKSTFCEICLYIGIRCDGKRPVCFWCATQGWPCTIRIEDASPLDTLNTDQFAAPLIEQIAIPRIIERDSSNSTLTQFEEPKDKYLLAPGFYTDNHFHSLTHTDICGTQANNSPQQEENFHSRPSIRITIPDHLKNLLVDDWENVTKSLLLVPLPSQAPANFIIDSYYNEEKQNLIGSLEADVLEEFCAGMKVYFEKSLGKILLYRFERNQLADTRKLWESGKYPDWEGKGPGDCYGAEHLCRMLVNLPEMIAQTNMDTQSVGRLKEEISKFCVWLARNSVRYFCAKYEKPSAEYIEAAR